MIARVVVWGVSFCALVLGVVVGLPLALSEIRSELSAAGHSGFQSPTTWVATSFFLIGLLVRVRRWIADARREDRRGADERRVRRSVRRLAEDTPLNHPLEGPPEDPDPALFGDDADPENFDREGTGA